VVACDCKRAVERLKYRRHTVDFRILGPLEVWHDGRPVPLSGARQRALLAILLVHAGEVVSSDRLMDDLWGEKLPAAGHTALRVRVSQLRKALGPGGELLVTQAPGYALRIQPSQLDLARFERMVADGERALGAGEAERAVEVLGDALGLWRGAPLADLPYAPFAQAPVVRLQELRLAAVELRIDAELALGRHRRLAGELQALVAEHPLRERLCGQLMLALYRDGRQAAALAVFSAARTRLVEEIGIEPGPPLRELQQRILEQDPELAREDPRQASVARTILALPGDAAAIGPLVEIARDLALEGANELVAVALVRDAGALPDATDRLNQARAAAADRGARVRVAAFTSTDAGDDAVRLVTEQDVALLLLDAPAELLNTGRPGRDVATIIARAVCDVALVAPGDPAAGGAVLVPFAGHEHDWAALELGAWLAVAHGVVLRLIGVEARADAAGGGRDASRLLASASLALQRGLGIAAESTLVPAGVDGVLATARHARALVIGLSERWEREGLGEVRLALARGAQPPVLFVRRGLRPGGMAPPAALTRFTWSGVRG
jgi:DNA-binding SARP family transcriptional activator